MEGKTVLITGANSGIGKVTARELARMGAAVTMICRNRQRAEAARKEILAAAPGASVQVMLADLSSMAEVHRVAGEFLSSHDRLDVLLNNAGAIHTSRTVTMDGYETTFATNHLAYFLMTHLLLDLLKASSPSRIINVASGAHHRGTFQFDDPQSEHRYSPMVAYRQSKLANVLFTYELARRLEGTGVTVNAVHPGVVRTGFAKSNAGFIGGIWRAGVSVAGLFFIGPDEGAKTSIYLASSPEVQGVSGKYFVKCRPVLSSPLSRNHDVALRLWDVSARLTGIEAGTARA